MEDGGWWPQSRDLAVELADLVDHFPSECGRVVRALFSPPDRPAWWLVDHDDRVLAWSGTTYASLAVADHAAHRFRVEPAGREYRLQERRGDSWRWTAWNAAGERVAVSGAWFATRAEAGQAARRMCDLAGGAIGP